MPSFSFVRILCLRICLPFVLLNNSFAAALSASLGKVSIKAVMSFSVFFPLADFVLGSRASTSCSAISSPFCPLSTTEAPYRSCRSIVISSSFSEMLRCSSGIAVSSFLRVSESVNSERAVFFVFPPLVVNLVSVTGVTKFCSPFINA